MTRIASTAFAAVLLFVSGCGKPAQIGSDEEVHKATDALFTALTARDANLLDQCEKRLDDLASGGKLPDEPHRALRKIIGKARDGKWESAAERLYDFVKGQETGPEHAPRAPAKAGRKK
jgi:hypothetical protein